MYFISFFIFLLLNGKYVRSTDTNCEESQKLFADLCFSPNPTDQFDAEWVKDNQPDGGWYGVMGNDINRLFNAELLRGKVLTEIDEDIEQNMCFRVKLEHAGEGGYQDGRLIGFGGMDANFTCDGSKDFIGVEKCKLDNTISQFHEDKDLYFSYFDKKNFLVVILCYPTGQVGWHTISTTNELTEDEKQEVNEHVASLGFPSNTTVELYKNENCS